MIAPPNSTLFWEKQLFFKRKMKKSLKINEIWANLQATTFEISLKIFKIVQILIFKKMWKSQKSTIFEHFWRL